MSWTSGLYFSKAEDEKTRAFLEAQGLDERQTVTVETFIRQKIVAAVYFYTTTGITFAALVFCACAYLFW
ncbi:hypothetical protein [Celeribacter halophilus]|uniref:hypothetical protein n=1 Tax=Celeribacter halophilus TaxID=576117 RepID=UPI003A94A390